MSFSHYSTVKQRRERDCGRGNVTFVLELTLGKIAGGKGYT